MDIVQSGGNIIGSKSFPDQFLKITTHVSRDNSAPFSEQIPNGVHNRRAKWTEDGRLPLPLLTCRTVILE